jgi:hypothetical protein
VIKIKLSTFFISFYSNSTSITFPTKSKNTGIQFYCKLFIFTETVDLELMLLTTLNVVFD